MKTLVVASKVFGFVSLLISVGYAQPGSLDVTFNPGTGPINWVQHMALQTNGQVVISGIFVAVNGATRRYLARLNQDGSVDENFDPGEGPNNYPMALVLQSDGKILIGGAFTSFNNQLRTGIARLRSDASLDTSFNPVLGGPSGGGGGSATAFAVQGDGKVLIGGNFSSVNGINRTNVARLNTNGTVDVTFDPGTGLAGGYATAVGLQSDGSVIVGGYFTAINGISRNYLARLSFSGSVDTNFDAVVGGDPPVSGIAVQPDDKFFIVGSFSSVNGYSRNGIALLNADGSVDTTFHPSYGSYSNPVKDVAVQSDGKVIIVGGFNPPGVGRFNTNGSRDITFNPGTGASGVNSFVGCVASQPDGKTLIGGGFTQFNGTNINYIARLKGDTSPTTNLQFMAANSYFGTSLSGSLSNTYRIEWTTNLNTPSLWTPLFNVTLQTNPQFILDPNPAAGQRFYRAVELP